MNRQGLTPLLLSATLFLAAGAVVAVAADEAKPTAPAVASAPGMMKAARVEELMRRFDANHDGKLDEDEVAAAHEAILAEQLNKQAGVVGAPDVIQFRQKMIELFDKNRDGRLDPEERAEMRLYLELHGLGPDGQIHPELIKRFDKNGDGRLDEAERAEMERFLEKRHAQQADRRELLLREFDHNGNGRIDPEEVPELDLVVRTRLEANPQRLARYDKNHDGKLDDAEWAEARKQILELVNNPGL